MTRSRRRALLVVAVLAVLVNLPLVHSWYQAQRVRSSGTDVTATVVDHRILAGDEHWVSFRFPVSIDPDQKGWDAEVDAGTYRDAVSSGEITVRVLKGDPSAYRAEGTVDSNVLLVVTLLVDVILVVIVLLVWRYAGRMRAQLRAVALEDVERCAPETLLEREHGEDFLIRGEVLARDDHSVTIDLGNRSVVVLLDGHANPVGHQQPAQVRARLIG
jgi:hypothetical protein